MKTVYVVRHGQTVANAGGVYLGARDPLNEEGKRQALLIAERCAKLPIDWIISSTMDRARDTASAISERIGKPFELSDEFVESLEPDSLMGRHRNDKGQSEIFERWRQTFFSHTVRVENGENFDDMSARAIRALKMLELRPEQNLLVVTHGYFARMLLACVIFGESLTPEEFKRIVEHIPRTQNTHLNVFHYDDPAAPGWSLNVWNDHAHLG